MNRIRLLVVFVIMIDSVLAINFLSAFFAFKFKKQVEHMFRLEKYGNCPKKDNLSVKVVESSTVQIGRGKVAINAVMKVSDDHHMEKVDATFFKCKERSDPSCEQVLRYSSNSACDMIKDNNEMWSSFLNAISPQMSCPIKKGIYKMENGTFDFSKSRNIIFNSNYWKLYLDGYEGSRNIFCFILEFDVVPYKKKSIIGF